jgi:hypothetical protein
MQICNHDTAQAAHIVDHAKPKEMHEIGLPTVDDPRNSIVLCVGCHEGVDKPSMYFDRVGNELVVQVPESLRRREPKWCARPW